MDKLETRRRRLDSLISSVGVPGSLKWSAVEKALQLIDAKPRMRMSMAAALGLGLLLRGSSMSMTLDQLADKFHIDLNRLKKDLAKLRKGPATMKKTESQQGKDDSILRSVPEIFIPSITTKDTLSQLDRLAARVDFQHRPAVLGVARELVQTHSCSGNLPITIATGALAEGLKLAGEPLDYQSLSSQAGISKQTLLSFLKGVHTLAPQQSKLLTAKRSRCSSKPELVQEQLLALISDREGVSYYADLPPISQLEDMRLFLQSAVEGMKAPALTQYSLNA